MGSHRLRPLHTLIACALIVPGLAACGAGSGGTGSGKSISILYVNNDNTLQKVLTSVRGGTPPDIAYLYGSWAPNVAKIPQVVNLTKVVSKPSVNWNDFWVG